MIDGINQSPAQTYVYQKDIIETCCPDCRDSWDCSHGRRRSTGRRSALLVPSQSGLQTGSIHVYRVMEIKSKPCLLTLNHHWTTIFVYYPCIHTVYIETLFLGDLFVRGPRWNQPLAESERLKGTPWWVTYEIRLKHFLELLENTCPGAN